MIAVFLLMGYYIIFFYNSNRRVSRNPNSRILRQEINHPRGFRVQVLGFWGLGSRVWVREVPKGGLWARSSAEAVS